MSGPDATIVAVESPRRFRAAIAYAVEGDLRFISHRDEMRMLARAAVRADWPVLFSRGFNPRPRISVPAPRSVGMAAGEQWALIELQRQCPAADLFARLAPQIDAFSRLLRITAPAPLAAPHPRVLTYELDLGDMPAEAAAAAASPQTRPEGPLEVTPISGTRLRIVVRSDGRNMTGVKDIFRHLGLADAMLTHRLRRIRIEWDIALTGPDSWPANEGESIGKDEENHEKEPESSEQSQSCAA